MNITEHNANGVVYLAADGFQAAGGVVHGFSTRLGGVSEGIYASMNLGVNRGTTRSASGRISAASAPPSGQSGRDWSFPAKSTGTGCAPLPPPTWARGWSRP